MAKIARSITALAVAVFCIVLLAGYANGPAAETPSPQTGKTEEIHQETYILVEAFVVEVRLASLYELGVNPLGKKPDSVSVDNLLNCLKAKDVNHVTSGVKVSLLSKVGGKTKITETTYVERQTRVPVSRRTDEPVVSKSYQSYDNGNQFDATASIDVDGGILVDYQFSQSTCRNAPSGDGAPPNIVNRQWSGTIHLKAGEPSIAGSTQNEETAAFLVLCAHIEGK
jgi:hypothetical protein